jgi:hypothetical protein
MADPKKQSFVFDGDDGNEYEFAAPTLEAAVSAARKFAQTQKIGLTAKFDTPEAQPPSSTEMPEWMKAQAAQNQAAMGENMSGGPLAGLGLGKLAVQFPKAAAGYLGANALDNNTAPGNEGNRALRDITRVGPAMLAGGPVAGASNFALGRLFDKFFKENNAQPPGPGEVASEAVSNVIPGLNAVGNRGGKIVQAAKGLAENNPLIANMLSGGATAGLAAQDRTTPTNAAVVGGAGAGALTNLLGRGIQRGLKALPSLENPEVMALLQKFGYRPEDIPEDRKVLGGVSELMGDVSEGVDVNKANNSVEQRIQDTARKIEAARSLEAANAQKGKLSALKVVAKGNEDEALKRLSEARAEQAAKAAVKVAKTPEEKALAEGRLWTLQQGIASRRAQAKAAGAVSKDVLVDAETYQNRLKDVKQNSKFAQREREIRLTAANEEFDKIANSGYDPRSLDPDQISTVKLLAKEDPGRITSKMFADKDSALTNVIGMKKLFGEKSPEFDSVKNYFIHKMFTESTDRGGDKFGGIALSGTKLGHFLEGKTQESVDELLGAGAYRRLNALENMLTRSAKIRTPGEGWKIVLTPAALGGILGGLAGGSEHGTTYGGVGLLAAGTLVGAWKTLPAMLDDAMRKQSTFGKILEKTAKAPVSGGSASRGISKFASKAGLSTRPTQEQTPSAQQ